MIWCTIIASILAASLAPETVQAQSFEQVGSKIGPEQALAMAGDDALDEIQKIMRSGRHAVAIPYLRAYLQSQPKDIKAWEMLGVCNYYVGLPKKAIRLLKYAEFQTSSDLGYNYLFQALAFSGLKKFSLATTYMKKAMNIKGSPFAKLAAYELVVMFYNRRKVIRAQRWMSHYIKKYPKDRNTQVLKRLVEPLKQGVFRGQLKGIPRPDVDKAFYHHAPLSLMPYPHYWFLSTGGSQIIETGKEVDESVTLGFKDTEQFFYRMNFDTGLGIGPVDTKYVTINGGYNYRQRWHSTTERYFEYIQDYLDVKYFLFRPDLLTRHHQFYTKFEVEVFSPFSFGLDTLGEITRLGTRLPGPEPWSWSTSLTISKRWLLNPWAGYRLSPRHLFRSYIYYLQHLSDENRDFSHQTFSTDLFSPLAYGITYTGRFPRYDFALDIDLFYYDFVYNDPYIDHVKTGVFSRLEYAIIPELKIYVEGTYSKNSFVEPYIKVGGCGVNKLTRDERKAQEDELRQIIKKCDRSETFWSVQGGVNFVYNDSYGVFFQGKYADSFTQDFDELSFKQESLEFGVVVAFPEVLDVRRRSTILVDRAVLESARQ